MRAAPLAALLVASACPLLVCAQTDWPFGAITACATGCLATALSAVGCQPPDLGCACITSRKAAATKAAPCVLSACPQSALTHIQSDVLAICSNYMLVAGITATSLIPAITTTAASVSPGAGQTTNAASSGSTPTLASTTATATGSDTTSRPSGAPSPPAAGPDSNDNSSNDNNNLAAPSTLTTGTKAAIAMCSVAGATVFVGAGIIIGRRLFAPRRLPRGRGSVLAGPNKDPEADVKDDDDGPWPLPDMTTAIQPVEADGREKLELEAPPPLHELPVDGHELRLPQQEQQQQQPRPLRPPRRAKVRFVEMKPPDRRRDEK